MNRGVREEMRTPIVVAAPIVVIEGEEFFLIDKPLRREYAEIMSHLEKSGCEKVCLPQRQVGEGKYTYILGDFFH